MHLYRDNIRKLHSKNYPLRALAAVIGLAWSGALVITIWTPDNYSQVYQLQTCSTGWPELGRPLMNLLYCTIFNGAFQPQLQLVLGLACLFALSILIALSWNLTRPEFLIAGSVICTYPFLCNIFGFETGKFSIPFALLVASASWQALESPRWLIRLAPAALLLSAGMSLYQTCINFLLCLILLSLLFELTGQNIDRRRIKEKIIQYLAKGSSLIGLAAGIYIIATELTRRLGGIGYNVRYNNIRGFETLPGLIRELRDIGAHYKFYLLPGHPISPAVFGFVVLGSLAITICSFLARCGKGCGPNKSINQQYAISLILLPASYIAVWSTDLPIAGSLLGDGYRHTYPVVLPFAATIILAFRACASHRYLQKVVSIGACLSVFSFIVADSTWAFDTYRLGLFDLSLGTRTLSRLQEIDPKGKKELLIQGSLSAASRPKGLANKGYDVLGSGFDNSGSAYALLQNLGLKNPPLSGIQPSQCLDIFESKQITTINSQCLLLNLDNL